jgi:formylglycine-generating enzyme required for sulfatase activity
VGRRLCTDTEWTNACSSNGAYEAGRETGGRGTCNDYTTGSTTTVPVASLPGCQPPASSGFAGVFDMIGNVEEWVDNCFSSDGARDACKPRGLPFGMGAAAPLCSQSTYAERSEAKDTVGFRCCAP